MALAADGEEKDPSTVVIITAMSTYLGSIDFVQALKGASAAISLSRCNLSDKRVIRRPSTLTTRVLSRGASTRASTRTLTRDRMTLQMTLNTAVDFEDEYAADEAADDAGARR